MAVMTYAEAARAALADAMKADKSVVALGEDLRRGGVFAQYKGLVERFGEGRVIDTPISESAIMGVGVGMALAGLRPVVELRYCDFAVCAADEVVNQAAKARFMLGGQARVPVVVRQPIGIWWSSAAQHSQSLEAWYAHVPGLVVVAPATPGDAYGLLRAAIANDDPVVFMEHKELWPLRGPVDKKPAILGRGRIARRGRDVTLVSWSRTLHATLEAARILAEDGIAAEVIDLRTLWPWDKDMVCSSVARTGRLVVAHEAVRAGGFGAEIAATVAEDVGDRLKAPIRRLGAPRIPVAYAPEMEQAALVTAQDIARAARAACARRAAGNGTKRTPRVSSSTPQRSNPGGLRP